jgi:carbon-monoxide dehydrogenase large subunit
MTLTEPRTAARFIGQSVPRREDPRLLTGHGQFVDDVTLPRMLHAHFMRSPVARGALTSIDVDAAREYPGVVAVLTAADVNHQALTSWPTMLGPDAGGPPERLLADEDVRYVGEPIAIIIAESRAVAEDAAELVDLDFEATTPIITMQDALEGTELVHPERDTNVSGEMPPVPQPEVDALFEQAAHVVTEHFEQHRYLCVPMEPRGLIASWDPWRQQLEVVASTQTVHESRLGFSRLLGIPEDSIRVVMGDVGGSFGQKMFSMREENAVVIAAKTLGRAVKWIEDRVENLIAGGHAREESMDVSFAFDDSGVVLAAKALHLENVGAYPNLGDGRASNSSAMIFPGPYRLQRLAFESKGV